MNLKVISGMFWASSIFFKGHLPSASLGEFVGEVVFVFLVENMMNRSKTCLGKTRPILKQLGEEEKNP